MNRLEFSCFADF